MTNRGVRGCFNGGLALSLFCGCLLVGCAGSGANVHLKSIPSEVEVVDLGDNTLLGMTPIDRSWGGEEDEPKLITVRFQKIGYRDRIETFTDKGDEIMVKVEMEKEEK